MMKSALFSIGLAASAARLAAAEITLPAESVQLKQSPLPGYALAQSLCVTCHSADYVLYQPPSSRAYWQAATVKMQKTFAAPIPDSAIEPIVDYLAKTYGTERTAATATPASRPAPPGGAGNAPRPAGVK